MWNPVDGTRQERKPVLVWVVVGAVIAIPAFIFALCLLVKTSVTLLRCESGDAVVVGARQQMELSSPFDDGKIHVQEPVLTDLSLRYDRQGKRYEKRIEPDIYHPDRNKDGDKVPILFDPITEEFFEGTKSGLFPLLFGLLFLTLLTAVFVLGVFVGWRKWCNARRGVLESCNVKL
jgi:hypothetical protein